MKELKIIESELVPVYETSTGEKVVYGTELHEALEVKSNYRDWVKNRLSDCEAIENEDFEAAKILAPSGQTMKEYIIKLDTAKEMAMLERNEKGKQVRRYFIKVEKKYKEGAFSTNQLSPELQAIFFHDKKIQQVDSKVNAVNNDLQHFKRDMPILGIEEDKITSAVRRKGVKCLGGKRSNAYNDRSLRSKVYSDIYQELYRQFGITTYKAIKRSQCDIATEIIINYELPLILDEQIRDCNAQESMEVA